MILQYLSLSGFEGHDRRHKSHSPDRKMRLINAKTLELHEFVGQLPKYVISSHRWEAEEMGYKDSVKG